MGKIKVFVSWSGNNYVAGTGEINGVVVTTHRTLEGVKNAFKESFEFHVDSSLADGDKLPDYIADRTYELDFELQVSALLHKLDGIVTRAALARVTGIDQRQLGHYIQGIREPRPKTRDKIIFGIHQLGKELTAVV
ncbi:MAG: XRE family transcriptional regulator [Clostridia bacterium]|nr:XRE family transcriptional regulator [Clostridia bacterium]